MDDVMHILFMGKPLCGFSGKDPAEWPDGHDWVNIACKREATCEKCKREVKSLENAGQGLTRQAG